MSRAFSRSSPHVRSAAIVALLGAAAFAWSSRAQAQDASIAATGMPPTAVAVPATDASISDASASDVDLTAASSVGHDGGDNDAAPAGGCQSDPVPSGHDVRVETRVAPPIPMIGDRVLITYRFFHRSGDSVEFDPDPVAYSQADIELEYARQQPDRDRRIHTGSGGNVYGEVQIAVQPFRTGEVTIPPQLARLNAAGDIIRVCTPVVRFRVREPFGNDPHPRPRDVTPPEAVSEDALRWRWIALGLDALFLVVVITLLVNAFVRSRPKKVVPPPPPRAPWLVALEALDSLERSDLLSRGLTKDYYDNVSDIIRRYVGGYRGFDALEMTTDEVLTRLRIAPLSGVTVVEIEHLLRECDLVKFARYVPTHEESANLLPEAFAIVRRSMPPGGAPRRASAGDPGGSRGSGGSSGGSSGASGGGGADGAAGGSSTRREAGPERS